MTLPELMPDLLREAATAAPSGSPDPTLWDRGRRYHRRRRAGTVLVVVVTLVLLGSLLGYDRHRARPIEPAGAEGAAAVPTRVWTPDPWLPSTDDEGPLGRLAIVMRSRQNTWFGSRDGVVGVSATTGEYRFLDLPDLVGTAGFDGPVLSPDGRSIAYWTTGKTTGSPNSESGAIAGVAVYDAATGALQRHPIETEHGVRPETLTWAGDDAVLVAYGQLRGGDDDSEMSRSSSSSAAALYRWRPGASGFQTVWRAGAGPKAGPSAAPQVDLAEVEAASATTAVSSADRGWNVLDLDDGTVRTVPGSLPGYAQVAAISADGSLLATLAGSRNPGRLAWSPLTPGARSTTVPGRADVRRVVGFLDARTVLIERLGVWGQQYREPDRHGFTSIDLRTGERHEIGRAHV